MASGLLSGLGVAAVTLRFASAHCAFDFPSHISFFGSHKYLGFYKKKLQHRVGNNTHK